jgi:hypothetical protein
VNAARLAHLAAAAVSVASMVHARRARAEPEPEPAASCTAVSLAGATPEDPRWRSAVLALREAVATLDDCPEVALSWTVAGGPGARSLTLRATGRGGAHTERTVNDPDSLVPIALGLLASAPREPAAEEVGPSAPPGPAPQPREPRAADEASAAGEAPPGAVDRAAIGATVGLELGGRVAGPTPVWMTEMELRGDLRVRNWLVMVSVRYAPLGASPGHIAFDDDSYNEMALGIGVGRRLAIGRSALDLGVMSSLVAINMEKDDPVDNVAASASQGRLAACARWSAPIGARVALVFTADGEVAPSALGGGATVRAGLLAPPTWTFGLRLGAASDVL